MTPFVVTPSFYRTSVALVLALMLGGCTSSQVSNSDRPYVEATSHETSFSHIPDIEQNRDRLTGPGFEAPQLIGGLQALGRALQQISENNPCPVRGRVSVQFVVDEQGEVIEAQVAEGIHERCDRMAIQAMEQMTFEPATVDGEPIRMILALPVTYE